MPRKHSPDLDHVPGARLDARRQRMKLPRSVDGATDAIDRQAGRLRALYHGQRDQAGTGGPVLSKIGERRVMALLVEARELLERAAWLLDGCRANHRPPQGWWRELPVSLLPIHNLTEERLRSVRANLMRRGLTTAGAVNDYNGWLCDFLGGRAAQEVRLAIERLVDAEGIELEEYDALANRLRH